VETHIKGLKMHKKESITPYCTKKHEPKGRRPSFLENQGLVIWRKRPNLY
jgi:hypothetical protein